MLWERLRFTDTIFSELFSTIDSFAGNPTNKHCNKISKNLSRFLADTPSLITGSNPETHFYAERIREIWDRHRGACKHGHLKEIPFPEAQQKAQPSSQPEIKDLFDLMEIARVCIIKMLLLDKVTLSDYSQIPVPTYKDGKDVTKPKRNGSAELFFKSYHPTPVEDAFFYTDLMDGI